MDVRIGEIAGPATIGANVWRVLLGRVRERAAIDALLERSRAGAGGCMVLHGEPGIGKSTLLGYAADRAGGMRVLRTAGVEPECDLGYATMHRLLRPVLDRIDRLPPPQAAALGVVLGRRAGAVPERFLVALATLSLLSEVAAERPALCLVDDAHWADRPSLDALAFAARRLDDEPVAVLLAARTEPARPFDVPGLVDLPLGGLDPDSAAALLASLDEAAPAPVERAELVRATGGNPLALRELPADVRDGVGSGAPVPLTARLQQAFLERVRRHDPAVQRLLLLLAADGPGRPDTVRRAATAFGAADVTALDLVGDLIREEAHEEGTRLVFRHPLMRSAVYHGAPPVERLRAHRVLAAALDADPAEADRRAWHLGQATLERDERVAEELERSAGRSAQRAGPAAAASALVRAAELGEPGAARARRLVAAAVACWEGGAPARAAALLDSAERYLQGTDPAALDVAHLRALMELRAGTPSEAVALLRPVLPEALRIDRHRAVGMLMLFGEASFHAGAAQGWAEVVAAIEREPLVGSDADDASLRLFRAANRVRAGRPHGLAPGDLDAVERVTDPARMVWAGGLLWGLGEHERGSRLRASAVRRARSAAAVGTLAWALTYLVSDTLATGRLAVAEAQADEGRRFAEETGQANLSSWYRAALAVVAAWRGRDDRARELAEEVLLDPARPVHAAASVQACRALGLLDLAAGRAEEALEHFRSWSRGGESSVHPGIVLYNVPELVEAAVRANLPEQAVEPLARYARWAEATGSPDLGALAARCRALTTSGPAAEAEFRRAIGLHARIERPLERARTELMLGQHLRRERRRSDARPHLRAALDAFRRIGAATWARRAEEELRATGEATRGWEPSTLSSLTPQELRIVAAVAEGATNREVATQLFLSPRTVDYHLRKVFRKAGIRSRAELIGRVRDERSGDVAG